MELDRNNTNAHLLYAHFLSNLERRAEALAEIKRAKDLDPLHLRVNAQEILFLDHAGRDTEALASYQKALDLDPHYHLANQFAASIYINQRRYAEAIAAARQASAFADASTLPTALGAYALAQSGRRAEARAELAGLLKLSTQRYVSPYNIALAYNGLGEREEALGWLERAYEERNARMTFLKVEPKWNNLRVDPRFQDLLRRVGFKP